MDLSDSRVQGAAMCMSAAAESSVSAEFLSQQRLDTSTSTTSGPAPCCLMDPRSYLHGSSQLSPLQLLTIRFCFGMRGTSRLRMDLSDSRVEGVAMRTSAAAKSSESAEFLSQQRLDTATSTSGPAPCCSSNAEGMRVASAASLSGLGLAGRTRRRRYWNRPDKTLALLTGWNVCICLTFFFLLPGKPHA